MTTMHASHRVTVNETHLKRMVAGVFSMLNSATGTPLPPEEQTWLLDTQQTKCQPAEWDLIGNLNKVNNKQTFKR